MSVLPVVVKAQPVEPIAFKQHIVNDALTGQAQGTIVVFYSEDIARERLGWEAREKALMKESEEIKKMLKDLASAFELSKIKEDIFKQKIKELANEHAIWRKQADSEVGFSFGVFLKQHEKELLGLTK